MSVPFIAVDAKTGFHIASHGLELLGLQTRSKSALAVLCNSVLLLWRNTAANEMNEENRAASQSFVVDVCSSSEVQSSVRYFHSTGHFLCVVFGSARHTLYANFAELLAHALHDGGVQAIKKRKVVQSIAKQALSVTFADICMQEGIPDCVLQSWTSSASLTCCHGKQGELWDSVLPDKGAAIVPGVYVCGELMYAVLKRGPARCVVAAYDAPLASFERMAQDAVLTHWCFGLCADGE